MRSASCTPLGRQAARYFYRRARPGGRGRPARRDVRGRIRAAAASRRRPPGRRPGCTASPPGLSHWFRRQAVELRGRRRHRVPALATSRSPASGAGGQEAPRRARCRARRWAGERDAVQLRVVEELGYAAIPSALDCTEAAGRTRVPRGLATEPPAECVMSEIPFVNVLGDAIERSAATRIAGRRGASAAGSCGVLASRRGVRRRRRLRCLRDRPPEQLASGIGCYPRRPHGATCRSRVDGPTRQRPAAGRDHGANVPVRVDAASTSARRPRHVRTCGLRALPRRPRRSRQTTLRSALGQGDRPRTLLAEREELNARAAEDHRRPGRPWRGSRSPRSRSRDVGRSAAHAAGRRLDPGVAERERRAKVIIDGGRARRSRTTCWRRVGRDLAQDVDRTLLRRRRRRDARPRSARSPSTRRSCSRTRRRRRALQDAHRRRLLGDRRLRPSAAPRHTA